MKIIFLDESNGKAGTERVATGSVIRIGRDPNDCQILFDQGRFPMVSRRHAEIRVENNRFVLVDLNSSFGTFVDGQRLVSPVEARQGIRIQFGGGGPVLFVSAIGPDVAQNPQPVPPAENKVKDRSGPTEIDPDLAGSRSVPPKPPPQKSVESGLEWVSGSSNGTGRIPLKAAVTTLGRDPGNDVVIDAAAAVVSRNHAQIESREGSYVVVDLGSFNGTLVNDLRIAQPTDLHPGDTIQLGLGGPVLRFYGAEPAKGDSKDLSGGSGWLPAGGGLAGSGGTANLAPSAGYGTIVVRPGTRDLDQTSRSMATGAAQPHLLQQVPFHNRTELTIGRLAESDVHLDGLQISNRHARLQIAAGSVVIEDTNSTN